MIETEEMLQQKLILRTKAGTAVALALVNALIIPYARAKETAVSSMTSN